MRDEAAGEAADAAGKLTTAKALSAYMKGVVDIWSVILELAF